MLDLATRILPIIIIIALALVIVSRIVIWRIRKGGDGNPPIDSGNSIDAGRHSTSSSHHNIPPPPAHH